MGKVVTLPPIDNDRRYNSGMFFSSIVKHPVILWYGQWDEYMVASSWNGGVFRDMNQAEEMLNEHSLEIGRDFDTLVLTLVDYESFVKYRPTGKKGKLRLELIPSEEGQDEQSGEG